MRCDGQIEEDPESEETMDLSWLLYDTAVTASGFQASMDVDSITDREDRQKLCVNWKVFSPYSRLVFGMYKLMKWIKNPLYSSMYQGWRECCCVVGSPAW